MTQWKDFGGDARGILFLSTGNSPFTEKEERERGVDDAGDAFGDGNYRMRKLERGAHDNEQKREYGCLVHR